MYRRADLWVVLCNECVPAACTACCLRCSRSTDASLLLFFTLSARIGAHKATTCTYKPRKWQQFECRRQGRRTADCEDLARVVHHSVAIHLVRAAGARACGGLRAGSIDVEPVHLDARAGVEHCAGTRC